MKKINLQPMPSFSFKQLRLWLLFSFLFLLAFNARKIFNFQSIQAIEGFRENLAFSLFLFELPLLIGLLGEAVIFLKNVSSNSKKTFLKKIDPLEKGLIFFLLFLALSLVTNFSPISLYAFWHLALAIGLFFWIRKIFSEIENIWPTTLKIIFFSGIFQSLLALFQFIYQKSLGLYWLGESALGPQILGVAKLELENQKFIRAYGTFPHPNLLGAFLLLALTAGLWLFLNSPKQPRAYFWGGLSILIGLFLTFSRSIWLATLFLLFFFFWRNFSFVSWKNSFLDFFNLKKFTFQKILTLFSFWLLFLGITFWLQPFLKTRLCLNCTNDQSVSLRQEYFQSATRIIAQHPWQGVGLGDFTQVLTLQNNQTDQFAPWEIQPVHNLFFLATAELGFLALFFFLGLLFWSSNVFWKTKNIFSWLFLTFLWLGFFDHYFWTLPQGQALFFLVLAFSAYSCKIERSYSTK